MATKKTTKEKTPEVPEAQMIDTANLNQAMSADDIYDLWSRMMVGQQEWTTAERRNQVELQEALYRSMSGLQREQAPEFAKTAYGLMQQYGGSLRDGAGRPRSLQPAHRRGPGLSGRAEPD
jgi:hypothetical protein